MLVHRIGDVSVIADAVEVPGLGALPINAFVIHAEEPVLVDTGRPTQRQEFLAALSSVIPPADLRWVWLSHPDRDHTGALFDVLELAPSARLVTTFMAVGYLSVEFEMPLDRVFLLNPGQSLPVGGGRALRAFRPPLFDSPMTVGFFDDGSGTLFSSDCFGAPLPSLEAATASDVGEIPADVVRASQLLWVGADSPWVLNVDAAKFASSCEPLRRFAPDRLLSTHLPPAAGRFDTMLDMLAAAPNAEAFVGPDQQALEAMLAQH